MKRSTRSAAIFTQWGSDTVSDPKKGESLWRKEGATTMTGRKVCQWLLVYNPHSKNVGILCEIEIKTKWIICKQTVFTDNGFMSSWANEVSSFVQSCVCQSCEPVEGAPLIPNHDIIVCHQSTCLPVKWVIWAFHSFSSLFSLLHQLFLKCADGIKFRISKYVQKSIKLIKKNIQYVVFILFKFCFNYSVSQSSVCFFYSKRNNCMALK